MSTLMAKLPVTKLHLIVIIKLGGESLVLCRFNFRSHLYIRERREKLLGKWVAFVVAVVGHIAAEEMVMEVKRILPKVHPTVMLILRHRLLIRLLNLGTFQPQSTLNSQGDIWKRRPQCM